MISSTTYRGAPSLFNRVYNEGIKRSVANFRFSSMSTFCGISRKASLSTTSVRSSRHDSFSSAAAARFSIRALSTQKAPEQTTEKTPKAVAPSNNVPLAGIRRSIASGGVLWAGVLAVSDKPDEKLVELAIGGGIAALITICLGRVTGPVARAMNSPEKIDWKKIAIEYSQRIKDPKVKLSEYEKLCALLCIPEDQKNNVALKIIELGLGRAAVYGSQRPLIEAIQSYTDMDVVAASLLASAAVAFSEQILLVKADAKLALSTLGPEKAVAQRLEVYLNAPNKSENLDAIIEKRHKELYAIATLAKHANDNRSIKEILCSDALIEKLKLSQEQVSVYKEAIERLPEPVKDFESFKDQMRELFRGIPYSFSRDFVALLASAFMIYDDEISLLQKNGAYLTIMGATTVLNNAMLDSRRVAGEFSFVKHFTTARSYYDKMAFRFAMTALPLVSILNSRALVLDWMKKKKADGGNVASTSPDVVAPTTLEKIEDQEGVKTNSTSGDLAQTVPAASRDDGTSILDSEELRALLTKLMDTFMPEMSEVSGKVASMDPAFLTALRDTLGDVLY